MESTLTTCEAEHDLIVRERTPEADDVVSLRLADPTGAPLPVWQPGAHVDLHTPVGPRQYSLTGDHRDSRVWMIAVRHEAAGRGGSAWVHEELAPGRRVRVSGPRNHFQLEPASAYVFIAGGIGITPLHAMIRDADRQGVPWHLIYGGRTRRAMAFADELTRFGPRVEILPEDSAGLLDVEAALKRLTTGSLLYACGPEPLLDALNDLCPRTRQGQLRFERFASRTSQQSVSDHAFQVELAESKKTITVRPGQSILRACQAAGVEVFTSCEEGICGTCETPVIDGTVEHHDSILTDREREENATMMICVSRAQGGKLVLDL